jgi:hypothetical protein
MRLTLFCVICLLAGCATTEPVAVRTVTVDRPVAVACVKKEDLPKRPAPTPVAVEKADSRQLAAAASADLRAMDLYADQVDAILLACARN